MCYNIPRGEPRSNSAQGSTEKVFYDNFREKVDIKDKRITDSPRTESPSSELPRVPSSVFAQVSGLQSTSPVSGRVTKSLIGIAVVLVFGASIGYYGQSIKTFGARVTERNLVTPEQQSQRLIRSGYVSQLDGKPDEAILSYREALALTPTFLSAYKFLGEALEQAGRTDEALKTYQLLLRKDPTNLDVRFQIAEIQRARGNWKEASDEYYRIISIDPQSLQARVALATVETYVDDSPGAPKGRRPFSRQLTIARAMASLLPSVQRSSSPLLTPSSDPVSKSLSSVPPLFRDTPNLGRGDVIFIVNEHKTRGADHLNAKNYEAAVNDFRIAMAHNPRDKDLYYLLGSAYAGLGQYQQAAEMYRRCTSGQYSSTASSGLKQTAKRLGLKKIPEMIEVAGDSDIGLPNQPTINNSLK